MSSRVKTKILAYTTVATAGETWTQGSNVDWLSAIQGYNKMNVIINARTLSGTSPTVTVTVNEFIDAVSGTNYYMTTAKSAALSQAGVYCLAQQTVPNAAVTNTTGAFPMLGHGGNKQLVFTAGGTIGAIALDVYFEFFED